MNRTEVIEVFQSIQNPFVDINKQNSNGFFNRYNFWVLMVTIVTYKSQPQF